MTKAHKIEILVLFCLFVCLSLIGFWAYDVFFAGKNTHILYFRDVDGIVTGSPVKFMGVIVGHVSDLEYKGGMINVKILITKRGVEFPRGSKAHVQFSGIAGSKSIEIEPPKDNNNPYALIITENPMRVKDIFEYSRSYTRALLSIENQIELISAEAIYKVLEQAATPYDWSNIDALIDNQSYQMQNGRKKVRDLVEKENKITEQVNRIKNILKKNKS